MRGMRLCADAAMMQKSTANLWTHQAFARERMCVPEFWFLALQTVPQKYIAESVLFFAALRLIELLFNVLD